jgi:sensor c-di-GMP phosphodiesterase-like protein
MKRSLNQRVLVAFAATVVGAACGMLAGYLLGAALTLRLAEDRLSQFATRIMAEGDASSAEARGVLGAMRASPYPFCSNADIFYLRSQIFKEEVLSDVGRIRDGKIVCTATLGRLEQPFELPEPEFSQPDGSRVYGNLAPFQIRKWAVVSLQLGDGYVIFYAHDQEEAGPFAERYTITVIDGSGRPFSWSEGALSQTTEDGGIRTRNGQGRRGESLYATRCSARYFNCVTAYISIPGALRADQGHFLAYIVLGGLSGALFGFAFSHIYRRSRSMEQQLSRAIRRDRLRVVYQPIVNLASGEIVGAEALSRWTDEEGFAVGPDIFVKIAEERGFVGEITRLVVRHVLRDFAVTLRAHADFRISINVAAADLGDPRFLPMLEQSLDQAGVLAASVAIEITESSTALHQVAMEAIRHLRRLGHHVHIDDFGTGYSSLSYLHDLSVDAIKIDQSFTRAIGTQAVTVSILPQILAMAEALNLQVIVEGIETSQQAGYFSGRAKSILGQGWLFGRPVPPEEFLPLLAASKQLRPQGSIEQAATYFAEGI